MSICVRSFLFVITTNLVFSNYEDCGHYFTDQNVAFDISPLTLTSASSLNYYNISSGDYHYLFNFCSDVLSAPSLCTFNDKNGHDQVYIDGIQNRLGNTSSNVFQYTENYCFRLSASSNEAINDTVIDYKLIDINDPSFGFIMHHYYGDYCRGHYPMKNRQIEIAFVCDAHINNIPNKEYIITEPETCVYKIEIKSIYGCPLQCGRDMNGNLCSNKGVCGYDWEINTAKCFCFGGYQGHYCNETVPFSGDIAWYENIKISNTSNYIYTFDTLYGFNITYDLQYINNYYRFHDMNTTNYYYVNLFNSFDDTIINSLGICTRNSASYNYGFIFQTVPNIPGAPCYSLGTSLPHIELYDETLPTKGVKISYENGENYNSSHVCSDGIRTNMYFICPDSNQFERMTNINGLNDEFSNFIFSTDETGCQYNIEIFTAAACPAQCITYDENNNILSQCNAAGVCAYDLVLDVTRCICDDVQIINEQNVQCYNPNRTYTPTKQPSISPTMDAITVNNIAWYEKVEISNTSDYIYTFDTIYGYNITYDLEYVINGYIDGKYYKLHDEGIKHNYYINLFNKTISPSDIQGICDNNIPDYDYGYVYQANIGNSLNKCFSLGRSIANIQLFDEHNPANGIRVSFTGGDKQYCDNNKRRQIDINFICPNDGGIFERYHANNGLNDIYSQHKVYEHNNCAYSVDIVTSAACPAKCITYNTEKNAVSQCTTNGRCGYDNILQLTRCFCNNDNNHDHMNITSMDDIFCANSNITFAPSATPTQSPTTHLPTYDPTMPPYITWINDIENKLYNESDYLFEFETDYNFNVTYDLTCIVMGYLHNKYYKLQDNNGHNIYFNLFNSTIMNEHPNIEGICDVNDANYSFGYIYQSHINDPNVKCNSIGRQASHIMLIDKSNPIKGIRLSYENGDDQGCTQPRRTDINFICPQSDANQFEIYKDNSLNDIFSKYTFEEPEVCQYSITIETSAACPIQCMSYDANKPSISQCNTNGYCAYTNNYVRCICNDNMIIHDADDIFCANTNITYYPTSIPTTMPTNTPSVNPTTVPTDTPSFNPTTTIKEEYSYSYSLFGEWLHHNEKLDLLPLFVFEMGIDETCENIKFVFITPSCGIGNSMWFGIGFGIGMDTYNNTLHKMNGYAILTFFNDDISDQETYESTLSPGQFAAPQSNQNLRECTTITENCKSKTICYRDYQTNDSEDFYTFVEGINPIIWAFGNAYNDVPTKHIDSSDSVINLKGIDGITQCGYAKSVREHNESTESIESNEKDIEDNIWMDIAIVLLVLLFLFGILFCMYMYYCPKNKRVDCNNGFVTTHVHQMSSVKSDTNEGDYDNDNFHQKDTIQLITKGNQDDDLL